MSIKVGHSHDTPAGICPLLIMTQIRIYVSIMTVALVGEGDALLVQTRI